MAPQSTSPLPRASQTWKSIATAPPPLATTADAVSAPTRNPRPAGNPYVKRYSGGEEDDLDANIVPYVVFGNEGKYSPTFHPRKSGIQPLSVVAVACGVRGDTNGDDGPPLVGEAIIAVATECFGEGITGDSGHDGRDVLYLAFEGEDAVPRKEAAWSAKTFAAFEESIVEMGDSLVGRLE